MNPVAIGTTDLGGIASPDTPLYNQPINIMIDMEMRGTRAGCAILSIGAVAFLQGDGQKLTFYEKIDVTSCYAAGLESEEATTDWWNEQDAAVFMEAHSGTRELDDVLDEFKEWLLSITTRPIVWSKSASCDLKVLEAAYDKIGIEKPWNFRDEMCFRTLQNLNSGLVLYVPVEGKIPHHALWDAIDQAAHAERCYMANMEWIQSARLYHEELAARATKEL